MAEMSIAEKMAILTGRKKVVEKPPTPPPRGSFLFYF